MSNEYENISHRIEQKIQIDIVYTQLLCILWRTTREEFEGSKHKEMINI